MPTPGYTWHVGNTRTGQIVRNIDLVDYSWTRYVDGPETLEGSFPLRSGLWPDAESDIEGGHAFLGVAYRSRTGSEHWLGAGPIRPDSINTDGVLQIGAAGLWSHFNSHRKLIPPEVAEGVPVAEAKVTYEGNELGLIAKRLIENLDDWLGYDASPPVIFPEDTELGGAGTVHVKEFAGYELQWVGTALKKLTEGLDGPEIQFVPRRRDDDPRFIEWLMRIGVYADQFHLVQSGNPWVFDYTVPESPVADLNVTGDASKVTHLSWAAGQGQAEGRPIVYATGDLGDIQSGERLLLESEVGAIDSEASTDALQSYADADVALNTTKTEQWVLKVDRDGTPHVGELSPGDWAVVRVKDHETIADGNHLLRIASIGGDTSGFVTLTMQPNQSEGT